MEINVLDKDYNLVAVVDDYISLIWCKRYYDVGALDLQLEATIKNIEIFKENYFITRNDDDTVYQIKAIQIDTKQNNDNSLIIGAVDCKCILGQRIIWDTVNFTGTLNNYIVKLISENIISPKLTNRTISNFKIKDLLKFKDSLSQQVSFTNLQEKIIELCKSYNLGWKITLENGIFYFDMFKGVDRSNTDNKVLFTPLLENLESSKYKYDSTDFKNSALIGGEGEGKDRKFASIGNVKGLDRFEMFVDGKSLSTNTDSTITTTEYNQMLSAKGYEEIAKKSTAISFEGEVDFNSYKYKTDYDIGDIVTIQNEYGISTNARITEVVETWDDDGYTLQPKFDYSEFEIPYVPTDVELKLYSSYEEDVTDEIVFKKSDFPFGLTIELFGGKGEDGEYGRSKSPVNFLASSTSSTFKNYLNKNSNVLNQGGLGGYLGDDVTLEFEVDGTSYTAVAVGGFGGGGGAADSQNVEFTTNSSGNQICIFTPKYGSGFAGGKGGFGNGLVFNVEFSETVKIKKITFARANDTRSQSGSKDIFSSYTFGNYDTFKNGKYAYTNVGYGGFSDGTYSGGGSQTGKDSKTIRTGEWTDYTEYTVSPATKEKNHICNVYKLVEVE